MKWLIALLILTSIAFASDPVDTLENKYLDGLTRYKVDYDAKCRRLSLAYIAHLEKLQVTTVKKGDLDGALKIKGKIVEIKKLIATITSKESKTVNNTGSTAAPQIDKVVHYVFAWPNGYVIDFQANGKYLVYKTNEMYKNKTPFHTTNTWKKTKDNTYDLFFNGKRFMQTVVIATDKHTFKIIDVGGSTHTGVLLDK